MKDIQGNKTKEEILLKMLLKKEAIAFRIANRKSFSFIWGTLKQLEKLTGEEITLDDFRKVFFSQHNIKALPDTSEEIIEACYENFKEKATESLEDYSKKMAKAREAKKLKTTKTEESSTTCLRERERERETKRERETEEQQKLEQKEELEQKENYVSINEINNNDPSIIPEWLMDLVDGKNNEQSGDFTMTFENAEQEVIYNAIIDTFRDNKEQLVVLHERSRSMKNVPNFPDDQKIVLSYGYGRSKIILSFDEYEALIDTIMKKLQKDNHKIDIEQLDKEIKSFFHNQISLLWVKSSFEK
jgi:alpha-glucosidase (family GH31 glycosyl hydrolase)